MKTIKQGPDDGMCSVCVCAMATGATTQEVYDFFGNDREHGDPINMAEVAIFLTSRGKVLGSGHGADGRKINQNDPFIHFIRGWPALVVVDSGDPKSEWDHALYWDGRYLRDPDPRTGLTVQWESYDVKFVFPLASFENTEPCARVRMEPGVTPTHVLRWREGVREGAR